MVLFSGPVSKIYHFKKVNSRAPLKPMVTRRHVDQKSWQNG